MPVVGVVGLGDIGRGVATGVFRAGLELAVFDVRAEAKEQFAEQAKLAADVAELGRLAEVVVVAVVYDDQVRQVLLGPDGALAQMREGSAVIVLSTVSLATVHEVAAEAKSRAIGVLDCGVSGGPAAAARGELVAMVGGSAEDVDRVRPILDAFSAMVVWMGPLGAGLQAKLARNIVQYGSWLAAYEAQRLAEAAGIKLSKLAEVIRVSDEKIGGSSRLMFRETVAPFGPSDDAGLVGAMRTASELAHKDLRAALELAGELDLELPMTMLAEARIDDVFGVGTGA